MTAYETILPLLPEGHVQKNEPMSRHTSFKIGGPADVFATPTNTHELAALWKTCLERGYPITVLGGGCNVLVSDTGIRGVLITTTKMDNITVKSPTPSASSQQNVHQIPTPEDSTNNHCPTNDRYITAGSGTKLAKLADAAYKAGLSGLEFASGIPGTVGGAIYMNAGAFGHEIKDICESVTVLNPTGDTTTYPKETLALGYRASRFQKENTIITEATFKLPPGNPDKIKARTNELNTHRKTTQPLDKPSAGSTFKRPSRPNTYASKLIADNNLKGLTIGGAMVSQKHAGFIINKDNATAIDVLTLMEAIQDKIYKATGIMLEPEVQLLGF